MSKNKKIDRREFIGKVGRISVGTLVLGTAAWALAKNTGKTYVWQIDPYKCTQCGRCETDCVLSPSASKCVHVYDMCGYCDLCGAYFKPNTKDLNTAAEHQLCPTAAIERKFIEPPYFEYTIIEDLCIGCAKCVKGCTDFGNGSLQMQIIHEICVNCNECAIARVCPSDAISRIPVDDPYEIKGEFSYRNKT